MRSLLLSILTLLIYQTGVLAQNTRILRDKQISGTTITTEELEFLMSQQEALDRFELPSSLGMMEIPVKIHVVRSRQDKSPVSIQDIKQAFTELNKHFINIYVQFVPLGDFNYIPSEKYFTLNKEDEEALCSAHDVPNLVNLYIVGEIEEGPIKFCGYTHYPQEIPKKNTSKNKDRVFISKSCLNDKVSLPRQMGHYFTLFSTSGIHQSETNEWVNGTNCKTEGDLICDTPADPGLTLATVDDRCGYTGRKQDQSGRKRFYKPDTKNIMCENPRLNCCDHFTAEQYKRMLFAAINLRTYLSFPKSEYSKKQLKVLAEEKGIEGEVIAYFMGNELTTTRDINIYANNETPFYPKSPYSLKITNHKKGYVYVLEGDRDQGIYLRYPLQGDKFFFREKAEFTVPSNGDKLKVDRMAGEDGKNHIIVLFAKKQLKIEELINQMNEIDADIDVIQRVYSVIGTNMIPSKNLTYAKSGIKVSGIATDQQIVPVIIEYLQPTQQ